MSRDTINLLTVSLALITAIIVMITKVIELALARKKAASDSAAPSTATPVSKQGRRRLISDLCLLTGILVFYFSTVGSSAPATRSDLGVLSFIILSMIVLFRPHAPSG